jgi:ferritin-like metal-binding protein YciE
MTRRAADGRRLKTLADLHAMELRDLKAAEDALHRGLREMARATRAPVLRKALEEQRRHVEERLARLSGLGVDHGADKSGAEEAHSAGAEGILGECQALIRAGAAAAVLDAALIVAVQKMLHHVMAGYGAARSFAGILGDTDMHALLQESLNDAADGDRTLTKLAEDVINPEAAHPGRSEPAAAAARPDVEVHNGEKIR